MHTFLKSTAVLSLALLLGGCGSKEDKNDTAAEKEAKPLVKIETVDSRDVVQEGRYTATVDPFLINNISAAAPNRIKQIYVDEGMRVSKGQKLAVMDDVTPPPTSFRWTMRRPTCATSSSTTNVPSSSTT